MKTQKEVVYEAVMKVMGQNYKQGVDCRVYLADHADAKKSVTEIVTAALKDGTMIIENEQKNVATYISGLISNHLRKDTRLNGGTKYKPANPGSRAGQGDASIKAIRQLISCLPEGSAERTQAQAELNARIAAKNADKARSAIDVENLPEGLKALVSKVS